MIGSAPESLNTLEELAAAFNNNPDILDNILVSLSTKAEQGAVYTKVETDEAIGAKQDALTNAESLAKYEDGTFDGLPIAIVDEVQW